MLKRTITLVLSLIFLCGLCVAFAGCSENAINRLQREIDDLKRENDNLSQQIDELEKEVNAGLFYTLSDAYEKGYLTQEELLSIAYYNYDVDSPNAELMGDNYQPIAKTPEKLSESQELAIKQSLVNWIKRETTEDAKVEYAYIVEYYGTYNGGVALILSYMEKSPGGFLVRMEYTAGGVQFCHSSYNPSFWTEDFTLWNQILFWKGSN